MPFTSFKSNFLSSSLSSCNRGGGGGGDGGCFHKNIIGVEKCGVVTDVVSCGRGVLTDDGDGYGSKI